VGWARCNGPSIPLGGAPLPRLAAEATGDDLNTKLVDERIALLAPRKEFERDADSDDDEAKARKQQQELAILSGKDGEMLPVRPSACLSCPIAILLPVRAWLLC
jgi:hypothetical protein